MIIGFSDTIPTKPFVYYRMGKEVGESPILTLVMSDHPDSDSNLRFLGDASNPFVEYQGGATSEYAMEDYGDLFMWSDPLSPELIAGAIAANRTTNGVIIDTLYERCMRD